VYLKQNILQQKTNIKQKYKPGVVASYDLLPGNGTILQEVNK